MAAREYADLVNCHKILPVLACEANDQTTYRAGPALVHTCEKASQAVHEWGRSRISSKTAPIEDLKDPRKRLERERSTKIITDRCRAVIELSQALNVAGAIEPISDLGASMRDASQLIGSLERVEKYLESMQAAVRSGACTPLGILEVFSGCKGSFEDCRALYGPSWRGSVPFRTQNDDRSEHPPESALRHGLLCSPESGMGARGLQAAQEFAKMCYTSKLGIEAIAVVKKWLMYNLAGVSSREGADGEKIILGDVKHRNREQCNNCLARRSCASAKTCPYCEAPCILLCPACGKEGDDNGICLRCKIHVRDAGEDRMQLTRIVKSSEEASGPPENVARDILAPCAGVAEGMHLSVVSVRSYSLGDELLPFDNVLRDTRPVVCLSREILPDMPQIQYPRKPTKQQIQKAQARKGATRRVIHCSECSKRTIHCATDVNCDHHEMVFFACDVCESLRDSPGPPTTYSEDKLLQEKYSHQRTTINKDALGRPHAVIRCEVDAKKLALSGISSTPELSGLSKYLRRIPEYLRRDRSSQFPVLVAGKTSSSVEADHVPFPVVVFHFLCCGAELSKEDVAQTARSLRGVFLGGSLEVGQPIGLLAKKRKLAVIHEPGLGKQLYNVDWRSGKIRHLCGYSMARNIQGHAGALDRQKKDISVLMEKNPQSTEDATILVSSMSHEGKLNGTREWYERDISPCQALMQTQQVATIVQNAGREEQISSSNSLAVAGFKPKECLTGFGTVRIVRGPGAVTLSQREGGRPWHEEVLNSLVNRGEIVFKTKQQLRRDNKLAHDALERRIARELEGEKVRADLRPEEVLASAMSLDFAVFYADSRNKGETVLVALQASSPEVSGA